MGEVMLGVPDDNRQCLGQCKVALANWVLIRDGELVGQQGANQKSDALMNSF